MSSGGRPMAMVQRLAVVLVLPVILAACAMAPGPDTPVTDEPPGGPHPPGPAADGRLTISTDPIAGPALQVDEALGTPDEPIVVAGALFVDSDGRVLLCSAIAESFPPQCGGERLEVIGVDLGTLDLQQANGVRWAEAVELAGTVD